MTNDVISVINNVGTASETSVLTLILVLSAAVVIGVLVRMFLTKKINEIAKRTVAQWDDILVECGFFNRVAFLVPGIILYVSLPLVDFDPVVINYLMTVVNIYMLVMGALTLSALFSAIPRSLQNRVGYAHVPLKGFSQVAQIVIYSAAGISIIGILVGRSPLVLLGGLGAGTAVLMLIFKDTILGFVAGIQISANKMLNIGDWLEMPKYGADGAVIDISLTTVKVQNWDKTISTIPCYALVTDSFKNWRGMSESGGRRIMRSILIDMTSIRYLDDEMIEKFKNVEVLKPYIEQKLQELDEYNKEHNTEKSVVNGRRLTNIGTFRAYLVAYLKRHPMVNQDMTFIVRQLAPTSEGLPMQIYVFCKDKVWANYEAIQSDIFDHVLASISEFGLKVYQSPTGSDFQNIVNGAMK